MDDMKFCNQCEHFERIDGYKKGKYKYVCTSPENKKDSWMEKGSEYIGKPQDRNRDNNCPDWAEINIPF